jgi:hypothetical protein
MGFNSGITGLNSKPLSPPLDSSERGTAINVYLTLGAITVIVFRYYTKLTGGSSGYLSHHDSVVV